MKKETVICAMLATATCATAQNGKFPTSGVSADSVQTEKDSIKADKEAEIQAVTVTGHRPMYKMRNDALVTRVRNTPLAKEPTLEDVLKERLDEIDDLVASNKANKKNIEDIFATLRFTFQKLGLVKYDAFNEMGGKLSFSLAMLNERNDGYIINAMHSREGCYTYIKEIIDGNSIIALSEEEKEALEMAMKSKDE